MKTVEVPNKLVYEPGRVKNALVAANFAVDGVVSRQTPPTVFVYLQDAEMKDPTAIVNAYQNPAKLEVTSNKSPGVGGVPEAQANGSDIHTLTIKKINRETGQVMPGSEQVQIIPSQLVAVSPSKPNLNAGQATAAVGPTNMVGEIIVKVCDPAGALVGGSLRLRFA
jgi:hypothetical protein